MTNRKHTADGQFPRTLLFTSGVLGTVEIARIGHGYVRGLGYEEDNLLDEAKTIYEEQVDQPLSYTLIDAAFKADRYGKYPDFIERAEKENSIEEISGKETASDAIRKLLT